MAHGGARPGAGRRKGSLNKATVEVADKLAAMGCDPFEGMAKLALQQTPCPTCSGAKSYTFSISDRGPYPDPNGGKETICYTCLGTGLEPIEPKIRASMNAELAQYIAPKRKAVEVSGPNGEPVQVDSVSRPPRQSREEWIKQRDAELGSVVAATGAATGGDRG